MKAAKPYRSPMPRRLRDYDPDMTEIVRRLREQRGPSITTQSAAVVPLWIKLASLRGHKNRIHRFALLQEIRKLEAAEQDRAERIERSFTGTT